MARRKVRSQNIRNIQQSGHSYYVTIPIELVRALGWRERQKVEVHKVGNKIIITDWQRSKSR